MPRKLLILGAGTAGTILANKLRNKLGKGEWDITIVDKNDKHYYQPGFLFIPFGIYGYDDADSCIRPIHEFIPDGVTFVQAEVESIDSAAKKVKTSSGELSYDIMVLAMGCHLAPEEVDGFAEGYGKNIFDFYTFEGALKLRDALKKFESGKLVINVVDQPIKCPVAPIEFMLLADYYFRERGIRDKVELEFVTSIGGAFTKPVATKILSEIMETKGIKVTPNFNVMEYDSAGGKLRSFDKREVSFDLLVSIPPNIGPDVVEDAGLGNGAGYAVTNFHTLRVEKAPDVYALGDNTNVPTSKAGSVAHFEAETVEENILRSIRGEEPKPNYDGHSICFIESGFHKALLVDFNYEVEPVPGSFPIPAVGPFSLLKESYVNHEGKIFFHWVYWNMLLKGKLPGPPYVPAGLSLLGKDISMLKDKQHKH